MGSTTRKEELSELGWRAGIGAAIIVGGYLALLLIPIVLASDSEPQLKTALTALIGFAPPRLGLDSRSRRGPSTRRPLTRFVISARE